MQLAFRPAASNKFMQSSMATANGFDCSKSFSRNLVKILKLKMHCSPGTTLAMSSSESSESIELGQSCQKPSESAGLQMWLVLCGGVWHSAQLSLAWSAPATMQSTCFDSSTRATLMPPAVICLWRNQQQFLCSPVQLSRATQRVVYRRCLPGNLHRDEQHRHRMCVCVYSKSDCNCMSNTTAR